MKVHVKVEYVYMFFETVPILRAESTKISWCNSKLDRVKIVYTSLVV